MPMKLNHRKDIHVLRGLAILAVVLFHADENYFPLGYLGVDVFFVISGFVVTPLILRIFAKSANEFGGGLLTNLSSFWKRRFYRLVPAMLFALSLSAIFMFILASPTSFKIYGNQFLATILFTGNYGVFKNSGDYFNNLGNPLIHTWSLSVEEQIYFLLPMIMVLLLGKNRYTKIRFAKIMSVITLASLILFIYPSILQPIYEKIGTSDPYHLFFYSPVHRVWQFTIGGLGYLLVNNNKFVERKRINAIHQIISLSLIWFIFGFLSIESRYASILVSFTTLLVICFRSLDSVSTLLKLPFEWLGDRSYSIYLFHMPFIFIAKSSPFFSNSSFNEFFILLAVALSITFGAFTYSKVENRYRETGNSRKSNKFKTSEIFTLLILSLALSLIMTKGADTHYWGLQKSPSQPIAAWEIDRKCERMSGYRSVPCIYRTLNATKSVLLIGDSHAAQFSQAIVEASKNSNWNSAIWTMPSCYFVLSNSKGEVSDSCLRMNKSIFDWVSRHQPNLVIISQYNRKDLPGSEMEAAILGIKNLVSNVLIVGNTPVFGDYRYMSSPALFQAEYIAPKKMSIFKMDRTNEEVSDSFLKGLTRKGIETVDLNYLWCDARDCNRFGSKGWLFFDTSHLSVVGATKAVPYFTNILNNY